MSQFDENEEMRAVTEELLMQLPLWKRPMPIMETIGVSTGEAIMQGQRDVGFFLVGLRTAELYPEWARAFLPEYLRSLHDQVNRNTPISTKGLDSKAEWIVELLPVELEDERDE